jgi:hypothetical protein
VNPNVLAAIRKRVESRAADAKLGAIVDETRAFFKIAGVSPSTSGRMLAMSRPVARILPLEPQEVEPGAAKIGGWPALPRRAEWPMMQSLARGKKLVPYDFLAQTPIDDIPGDVVTALGLSGARERMLSFFVHLEFAENDVGAPVVHANALVRVDPMIGLDLFERRDATPKISERPFEMKLDLSMPPETAQAAAALDASNAAVFEEADVVSRVIREIEQAWLGTGKPRHQLGGWASETLNGDNSSLDETPLLQLDDSALDLGVAARDGAGEGFVRIYCRVPPSAEGAVPARGATSTQRD